MGYSQLSVGKLYEVTSGVQELIVLGVREALLGIGGLVRILREDILWGVKYYVAIVVHDPQNKFVGFNCSIKAKDVNGLMPVEG